MKKLMIAAAVAAMIASVKAACIDPEEPEDPNCAMVYKYSASLKTLVSKAKTTKIKYECEDPQTLSACYLISGTIKLAGVLASCECDCGLSDTEQIFWNTSTKTCVAGEIAFSDSDIRFGSYMSNKATKIATMYQFASDDGYTLAAAGFGTFDYKKGLVKSLSGYIVGTVPAPLCSAKCAEPEAAYGFALCDDLAVQPETVPAYGSWSIKYDSSASKKHAKDSTYLERKLIPAYAWCVEDEGEDY